MSFKDYDFTGDVLSCRCFHCFGRAKAPVVLSCGDSLCSRCAKKIFYQFGTSYAEVRKECPKCGIVVTYNPPKRGDIKIKPASKRDVLLKKEEFTSSDGRNESPSPDIYSLSDSEDDELPKIQEGKFTSDNYSKASVSLSVSSTVASHSQRAFTERQPNHRRVEPPAVSILGPATQIALTNILRQAQAINTDHQRKKGQLDRMIAALD